MSSSDIAISVRNLSKSYTIAHNTAQHGTIAEAVLHKVKNPRQRVERETFWALKDVSFDIQKGDVVGIIGRNGAGKSTLLKILSRITEPTSGKAIMHGRVGSLLEVGTGFHPELTGRENIFLNGAILGMTRREIAEHFDAIVDFAEVEQFLDTPVKRYSSGMYVRLAFAVAAHLNPEILIVDEVLAVGDAAFQKKCMSKMKDVSQLDGRTILFVSHSMAAIRHLCKAGVLLNTGHMDFSGNMDDCVRRYMYEGVETGGSILSHKETNDSNIDIFSIRINQSDADRIELISGTNQLEITVEGYLYKPQRVDMEVTLSDLSDIPLAFFSPGHERGYTEISPAGPFRLMRTVELPARINKGEYCLHLALAEPDVKFLARFPHAVRLIIEGVPTHTGRVLEYQGGAGLISLCEPTSSLANAGVDIGR